MHIFHMLKGRLTFVSSLIVQRSRRETMQTDVTMKGAELAEANAIIKTCVHYGFCTNTCPTYVLLGDENESPRGRIDLIKDMLASNAAPKKETVQHLDNCLSCLSCMTTCAAKVDYAHLIDRARVHIEKTYDRPLFDRFIRTALAGILPNPKALTAALWMASLAQPLKHIFTGRLRAMLELAPTGARVAAVTKRQVFAAEGERRSRVILHLGCVQQVVAQHINDAAIRLLTRHGVEVVTLGAGGCCGALTLHMGKEDKARAAARQVIAAVQAELESDEVDAVVITASGCGTTVKDYGHLFAADRQMSAAATRVAGLTRDISELLHKLPLQPATGNMAYRVAYHDACSMLHGQKVISQPRALLKRAGFKVHDIPERHFCCGSAGTYNMLQPELAARLGQRKAANVGATGADILCAGNLGCLTQIGHYSELPAVHTVELLDWATGGPRPAALRGRDLSPETADLTPSREAALTAAPEGAFW